MHAKLQHKQRVSFNDNQARGGRRVTREGVVVSERRKSIFITPQSDVIHTVTIDCDDGKIVTVAREHVTVIRGGKKR